MKWKGRIQEKEGKDGQDEKDGRLKFLKYGIRATTTFICT